MGSGGLVVMDEDTCMVETARFFMNFTQSESCGKCVPCREGTKRMLEILTRIVENKGSLEDLDMLENLSQTIRETALCGLGQAACNPVSSTLKAFRNEYLAHVVDHHCPICNGPKAAASARRTARWTRLRARRRNRIPSIRPSASSAARASPAARLMPLSL